MSLKIMDPVTCTSDEVEAAQDSLESAPSGFTEFAHLVLLCGVAWLGWIVSGCFVY